MMLWLEIHQHQHQAPGGGGKGGGGGHGAPTITNFAVQQYDADLPWLARISQDELIDALRADGRRQAAGRASRAKREGVAAARAGGGRGARASSAGAGAGAGGAAAPAAAAACCSGCWSWTRPPSRRGPGRAGVGRRRGAPGAPRPLKKKAAFGVSAFGGARATRRGYKRGGVVPSFCLESHSALFRLKRRDAHT